MTNKITLPHYCFKSHFNLIPSIPWSKVWFLSLRFSFLNPICSFSPAMLITCPMHLVLLDLNTLLIFCEAEILCCYRLLITHFLSFLVLHPAQACIFCSIVLSSKGRVGNKIGTGCNDDVQKVKPKVVVCWEEKPKGEVIYAHLCLT